MRSGNSGIFLNSPIDPRIPEIQEASGNSGSAARFDETRKRRDDRDLSNVAESKWEIGAPAGRLLSGANRG